MKKRPFRRDRLLKDKSWPWCGRSNSPLGFGLLFAKDFILANNAIKSNLHTHVWSEVRLMGKKPCRGCLIIHRNRLLLGSKCPLCRNKRFVYNYRVNHKSSAVVVAHWQSAKEAELRLHVSSNISSPCAVNVTHLQSKSSAQMVIKHRHRRNVTSHHSFSLL